MIRRLLLPLVIVALLGVASLAQADEVNTPSCGQNSLKYAWARSITHNGNGWTVTWSQNCGTGGTVEWEVQRSVDDLHWNDTIDNLATTTSSDANQDIIETRHPSAGPCDWANYSYRLKVWDAKGGTTVNLAAQGC